MTHLDFFFWAEFLFGPFARTVAAFFGALALMQVMIKILWEFR